MPARALSALTGSEYGFGCHEKTVRYVFADTPGTPGHVIFGPQLGNSVSLASSTARDDRPLHSRPLLPGRRAAKTDRTRTVS